MDRDDDDDDRPSLAPALGIRFQQQQPRDWRDWFIDAIELLLQAFLRSLSGIVDFLDRIISAFERTGDGGDARMDEQRPGQRPQPQPPPPPPEGSSVWIRLVKWLGSGVRNILPGFPVLPQDRSSLWMPTVAVLLVCFIFLGFRTGFRLLRIVEVVQEVEEPEPEQRPPSKRLLLPDGRYIAYRELGVSVEKSKHSGLVVRGFAAVGQADIPGLNDSLLEQFKVRLIAYDLPGFGQSDPNPNRTFNSSAQDMELIANALRLGDKFWLLVHPGGGPYAWAAIRYIPTRLSGVVMLGPVGNPSEEDEDMTETEEHEEEAAKAIDTSKLSFGLRLLLRVPGFDRLLIDKQKSKFIKRKITKIRKGIYATQADKEQLLFEQHEFITFWEQNLRYKMAEAFPAAVKKAAAAPSRSPTRRRPAADRRNLIDFPRISIRFPSIPVAPAFRFFKSFIIWLWPTKSDDNAAAEPSSSFQAEFPNPPSWTWESFKMKFVLVMVLLLISFLVLR